jgi:hypothetical protein
MVAVTRRKGTIRMKKRFVAMKDGHWWSVVDLHTMKRVPCPLEYIRYYNSKKEAKLVAKALNSRCAFSD